MHTRRHLKPETFPFLAVLLCAMGSLILLLLVMDRRAKAVFRARALQVLARITERDAQADTARQAEWEGRRQALHAELDQEDRAVEEQMRAVQGQMAQVAANVRAEETRLQEMRQRLQQEQMQLTGAERAIAAERSGVGKVEQDTTAARAQLACLTHNLEQLERALADLRAARQREQQTYSLVPYRGKHGDNRRPLYLECSGAGLIFHPDKQSLAGPELTPAAIRAEVERRIARQRQALAPATSQSNNPPYLLFLIRPDGINRYYQTLAGLKGLEIDYGYEFVERDWVLDFPVDDTTPAGQPWMTATHSDVSKPPPTDPSRRGPRGVTFNQAGGAGEPGASAGNLPGGGVPATVPTTGAQSTIAGSLEKSGGPAAPGSLGGSPACAIPRPNTGQPGVLFAPGTDAARSSATGEPREPGVGGPAGGVAPSRTEGPATSGSAEQAGTVSSPASSPFGSPGNRALAAPGASGSASPEGSAQMPTAAAAPAGTRGSGRSNSGPDDEQTSTAPAGMSISTMPKLPGAVEKTAHAEPIRPRLVGNRDWNLLLECRDAAVILYPGGRRFTVQALTTDAATTRALVETVQQLIAHRQATVRPGEPPYRPQLRFLVRPDGVQTFYRAYPLLDSIGVPMHRQNLEQDEEIH